MPTLIINNNLISSCDELRSELLEIKDSQSLVAREVRRYFFDNVLIDWLNEGEDYEKELSTRLRSIDSKHDDTALIREIVSTICGDAKLNIAKVDFTKCISLDSLAFSAKSFQDCNVINAESIPLPSSEKKIYLRLSLKVLEPYNEMFQISVNTTNSENKVESKIIEKEINLSKFKHGELFVLNVCSDFATDDEMNLGIFVDGIKITELLFQKDKNSASKGRLNSNVSNCQNMLKPSPIPSKQKKQEEPHRPQVRVIYE